MLEIRKIRENATPFVEGLKARFIPDAAETIASLGEIDQQRREIMAKSETLKAEGNQAAKSIGRLMKEGNKEAAEKAKAVAAESKAAIKAFDEELRALEAKQREILLNLPNIPHSTVPVGPGEADNKVLSEHGTVPTLHDGAKPHWDLARDLDIIDWELGSKITGSGFPVYKRQGAKLLRGLIRFFLDEAEAAGYAEMVPPLLVNEASGYATGQLPDKEGQMYHVTAENLFLIPTAEVPITNLYRDTIVDAEDLPIRMCGYTQCFRREAGAYGKDVRGLNRLHQFDKVEIVEIAHPDTSYERLEAMLAHARGLLDKLELPHRILLLCSGDMGFTSAKTYDLEVFSAAQERWLEVSSVSNFETYQANRLKLRYRQEKKNMLAHTLNGSALALPRIMAALLENNQQPDGTIAMPSALHAYVGERIG